MDRDNANLLARVHYINIDFLMYKDGSIYILKDKYFYHFCKRHFSVFNIIHMMVWSCYVSMSIECFFELLTVA